MISLIFATLLSSTSSICVSNARSASPWFYERGEPVQDYRNFHCHDVPTSAPPAPPMLVPCLTYKPQSRHPSPVEQHRGLDPVHHEWNESHPVCGFYSTNQSAPKAST